MHVCVALASVKLSLSSTVFVTVYLLHAVVKVVLCRDKETKKLFAMRVLKKDVIVDEDCIASMLSQNKLLQSTKHPFIAVNLFYYVRIHMIV